MKTSGAAAQPKRDEFFVGIAQDIETLRLKAVTRADADPLAAMLAQVLSRARAAAVFASRCDAQNDGNIKPGRLYSRRR